VARAERDAGPHTVTAPGALDVDVVVVPLFAERAQPQGAAGVVDWHTGGALARLVRDGRFEGAPGESLVYVSAPAGVRRGPRVMLFGLGSRASSSSTGTAARTTPPADAIRSALAALGVEAAAVCVPLGAETAAWRAAFAQASPGADAPSIAVLEAPAERR
jgi:hypothetical protein